MAFNVALLLKKHMIDYCKITIGDSYDTLLFDYYPYETLEEMKEIYLTNHRNYDGIITSGLIPHGFLSSISQYHNISLFYFRFDIENTYRIILQESVRRNKLDLSRIGLDFLGPSDSLNDVIEKNNLPNLVELFSKNLSSLPSEDLESFENSISTHYLQQYENNELDFIVTYFYSTVQTFAHTAFPVYYLYPSAHEIEYVMGMMLRMVQLKKAKGSYPSVIRINVFEKQIPETTLELVMAELHSLLLEYIKTTQNSLSLKSGYHYFELYTDAETLRHLTDDYRHCPLYFMLFEKISFKGALGYGISNDFYHARSNAVDACDYKALSLNNASVSYLINEADQAIALYREEEYETPIPDLPRDHIQKIAKDVKLSSETIFKIIGVLIAENTNTLTSTTLIKRLGLSLRTANRYLTNLEKYGYGVIVGQQRSLGKGRPINIYRVDLLPQDILEKGGTIDN